LRQSKIILLHDNKFFITYLSYIATQKSNGIVMKNPIISATFSRSRHWNHYRSRSSKLYLYSMENNFFDIQFCNIEEMQFVDDFVIKKIVWYIYDISITILFKR